MPVIKSAIKRMHQNAKRKARNFPLRSELKTLVKKGLVLIKEGNEEESKKVMPHIFSVIDKACKKNIIHRNTAARKKSRLARALNELQTKGGAAAPAKAETKAKKAPAKAAKKTEKTEE